MNIDSNLLFIKDKIYEVHSAIMYNFSNEVIRLPNSIVNVVKVDDEGKLWFTCDQPVYQPELYTGLFPVRLQFYRKGKLFHLEVSGTAEIENDLRDESEVLANRLLIKMKMKNISYTEAPEKAREDLRQWFNKVYRFLGSHLVMPHHTKPLARN